MIPSLKMLFTSIHSVLVMLPRPTGAYLRKHPRLAGHSDLQNAATHRGSQQGGNKWATMKQLIFFLRVCMWAQRTLHTAGSSSFT